ncbi:kelch-type beta propeller domain containing protein [Rhodotorula toruloides]|uniref:Kelch-type beta propeller domain containing protein n=1 Tax=Rhodotorula toruloides TaxID=5286 RepID=A0A511KPT6_RHOTO|nr:kelch-type beta propeller domain containing protein [Rhodotorula toruloides]
MRRKPRIAASAALVALLGTSKPSGERECARRDGRDGGRKLFGWTGVYAQTAALSGRWSQSSALLLPSDDPTLLVVSGKTTVGGQTVSSTPSTSSALYLNLSNPVTDLSSPPWQDFPTAAPIASYASLVPLSSSSALFFGGDATSDPAVALQTGNDSSWLLSLASTSTSFKPAWTHEMAMLWPNQPERREFAFTASATNGTVTRAWVFGGQRADGSGTTFGEMWELQVTVEAKGGVSAPRWAMWSGAGGPPPTYDGTAVLVPSTESNAMPSIYLIGGVQVVDGASTLAPLDSVWVFTPNAWLGGGSWTQVKMRNAPTGRRGHIAVEVGAGKIWIQGGRSADGSTVFSDSAVLDTQKQTWTKTRAGQQVWGQSAAMVGETVVMAFGYGVNAPASTALFVYTPANDTWLTAYYPFFITIPPNPKASGQSPSASSPTASSSPLPSSDPSSSSSSSPSTPDAASPGGNPSASSGSFDSGSTDMPQWTAPGSAAPPSSGTSDSSSGSSSGDGGSKPKGETIAGAVVGSILGALALGVAVRRYRDNSRHSYTGDDDFYARPFAGEGGGGSLMAEHRMNGGSASSEMYSLGKAAAPAAPSTGVFGALAGFLSPRDKLTSLAGAGRKRRFDMLKDEENDDTWDASVKEGWVRFDDDDEPSGHDRNGSASSASLKGRGGMAIWDGFGGIAPGVGRFGDSIRSSTSYLGGALGGFIGIAGGAAARRADPAEDEHEEKGMTFPQYAGVAGPGFAEQADPALTPIAEWEEEDARTEPDDSRTLESGYTHTTGTYDAPSSSTTHRTASTRPTSCEISPAKASRIVRPFSPASVTSLYGSNFASQVIGEPVLNRTSSNQSHASSRFLSRNNSSWWSRLNLQKAHQGGAVPTPTAFEAIRDPAPAPSLATIPDDPFVDPTPSLPRPPTASVVSSAGPVRQPSFRITRPDEHGRFDGRGKRQVRGEHDRSVSSNTSDVTATSSVLEERLRGMDVVQRVRTGSGGDSSTEVTPTLGHTTDGAFGRLPEASTSTVHVVPAPVEYNPFTDPPAPPPKTSVVTPSTSPRKPVLPISILPPTPTYAPPHSPRRNRLSGPRPQPLSPSAAPTTFSLPRSNSVKDLVANIERRNSQQSLASLAAPPAPSPQKMRAKVEHGLVKKQQLYIANP